MTTRGKSKIIAAVREAMQDACEAGVIDKRTLRTFDANGLTPVAKMSPRQVSALRAREGVSQAVFARHLNVAVKLVGEWERGQKRPSGPSLKLLALVKAKGLDVIL